MPEVARESRIALHIPDTALTPASSSRTVREVVDLVVNLGKLIGVLVQAPGNASPKRLRR
jgi:hypothetical protein